MTAKETATWSRVVNHEEALLKLTEKCLRISPAKDDREEDDSEHGHPADRGRHGKKIASSGEKKKCVFEPETVSHTDSTDGAQNILAVTDWLDMELAKTKAG
ncbi:hypothetical protein CRYUN_Cryun22dG0069600 [Craigia yunnanensis]